MGLRFFEGFEGIWGVLMVVDDLDGFRWHLRVLEDFRVFFWFCKGFGGL